MEALEFIIRQGAPVIGVPLQDLNLKTGVLIALIQREGRVILPRGSDAMKVGDTVIVITNRTGMCDIQDILKNSRGGLLQ